MCAPWLCHRCFVPCVGPRWRCVSACGGALIDAFRDACIHAFDCAFVVPPCKQTPMHSSMPTSLLPSMAKVKAVHGRTCEGPHDTMHEGVGEAADEDIAEGIYDSIQSSKASFVAAWMLSYLCSSVALPAPPCSFHLCPLLSSLVPLSSFISCVHLYPCWLPASRKAGWREAGTQTDGQREGGGRGQTHTNAKTNTTTDKDKWTDRPKTARQTSRRAGAGLHCVLCV